jgi:serine/threonine protein kinase
LKPRNILIETKNNQVKLIICDFGFSVKDGESKNNTTVGTESYVAPEVIQRKTQTEKVDLFSFGAILYRMLTGNEKCFYLELISNEKALLQIYETIQGMHGDSVAELIIKLLSVDPEMRPSSEECLRMLKLLKEHKSIKKSQLFKKSEISVVTILGAGFLGSKIAGELARCGFIVHLYDSRLQNLERAKDTIFTRYKTFGEDGMMKMSNIEPSLNRIHSHTDLLNSVKNTDFIIESLPENLSLKMEYLEKIEELIDDEVIIASCTLSLDLDSLFKNFQNKSRTLGMRLIVPVYFLSIVEYSKSSFTDRLTILRTIEFIQKMNKEPFENQKLSSSFVNYDVELSTRNDSKSKCKKCKIRYSDACVVPCGHVGHCMKCMEVFENCPFCNRSISSIIKIDFY